MRELLFGERGLSHPSSADSGHGGQQEATEGDEEDGYDENIYPLDHEVAGTIVDNDMHRLLVTPLPQGCRLTAIFDCVRSLVNACGDVTDSSISVVPLWLRA